MLLKDGIQFQLTPEQIKKYSVETTYTLLDGAWMEEDKLKDGRPNWKTQKKIIPLQSIVNLDGQRCHLVYCDHVVTNNVTTGQKTYFPKAEMSLTKGSFFIVPATDPEKNYYLQNCAWLDANARQYKTTPSFKVANSSIAAEMGVEDENEQLDIKTRILREFSKMQLLQLKDVVIQSGWIQRFRDDMEAKELAFELSKYCVNAAWRKVLKEAIDKMDGNFNGKVQVAIETGVLEYDNKDKTWSINEGDKKRTLTKVKFGVTKEAHIMGFFNNNPDEQRLLAHLMNPVTQKN
jgi:hypothetical protein